MPNYLVFWALKLYPLSKVTFGSVCSGIEASQLAFSPFGFEQLWSSEIAEFPSRVLEYHYPNIPNLGDMVTLPELILSGKVQAPDLFCGGTPCQAFSLAGWKNGLADERGQLTIKFFEIANAIDIIRKKEGKSGSVILWENVEGVLNDKTNAFGNFIAGLAGFDDAIKVNKWSKSGYLEGPVRNVAWRVIDAKYFGLPQQRRRLYVLAGDKDFRPDEILFEFSYKIGVSAKYCNTATQKNEINLFTELEGSGSKNTNVFYKNNCKIEFFRNYTDCLYSAYGTKWNGNAAAYNGSLYVSQNDRLRRFIPLECERLMGFPDNYTLVNGCSDTNRYQAIGNSWAVPVIKWIGKNINDYFENNLQAGFNKNWQHSIKTTKNNLSANLYLLDKISMINEHQFINVSAAPNYPIEGRLHEIVEVEDVPEKFYISPLGCKGILRRKTEMNMNMNERLEYILGINCNDKQEIQLS